MTRWKFVRGSAVLAFMTASTFALMPMLAGAAEPGSYEFEEDNEIVDEYLWIADADQKGLDLAGDFTIEAWIKPESVDDNQPMDIVSKDSREDRGYAFSVSGLTGRLGAMIAANGPEDPEHRSQFETNEQVVYPDVWQHVAVVFRPSIPSAEFYVNGVLASSTAESTGVTVLNNNAVEFRIGSRLDDTFFIDGLIDEVRVWKKARTATQIQNAMTQSLNPAQHPNLVGYWRFDGKSLRDSTARENHLNPSTGYSADVPY